MVNDVSRRSHNLRTSREVNRNGLGRMRTSAWASPVSERSLEKCQGQNRNREIRLSGSVSRKKLVCPVGDKPTKVIVRDLVAWIAERREIEFLMPIDKAIFRMVSKSSGESAGRPALRSE